MKCTQCDLHASHVTVHTDLRNRRHREIWKCPDGHRWVTVLDEDGRHDELAPQGAVDDEE